MATAKKLLRHLHGRPLLRRVLLSEMLSPPRSKRPHATARPPAPPRQAEESTGE